MRKSLEQLTKQYASCPTSKKEYEIDNKKYTLTRHFTGEKNIDRVIEELAVNRANRETGV